MAIEVTLTKNGIIKKGFVGFSWTTLFFGFFVPLFRFDFLGFIVMIVLACITGISWLIVPFFYNKLYTINLLERGWYPADEESLKILKEENILNVSNNDINIKGMEDLSLKKCSNCGNKIDKNSKFCPICGKTLMKTCKNCQAQVDINTEYCPSCGKKMND